MTELILKVWGKHIAHEYKHERPKYQLLPEIEKRIPIKIHTQDSRNKYRRDCSSRQNSNCGHTSTRTTTRTRRDSEASSSWSSSSDGAASCSESEYSSQSSDANTFSPKHQLRFFPDSTDQEIRAITIKYFGAFYLSCWHSHNGGNINKANNGLVRVKFSYTYFFSFCALTKILGRIFRLLLSARTSLVSDAGMAWRRITSSTHRPP